MTNTTRDKLIEIYNEIQKKTGYEDINKLIDDKLIYNLTQYYIHSDKKLNEEDINVIGYIIRILQFIYNNSDIISPVTDEDYDKLYEVFLNTNTSNIVGSTNPKNKKISNHKYPDLRGTLDKVHFLSNKEKGKDKRKSIEGWLNSIKNKIGRDITPDEEDIYIFPKFDGVSIIFECDKDGKVIKALTRGNVDNNEAVDVTSLFGVVKFNVYKDWKDTEFGVKTEVVIEEKNYNKLCKKYGSFNSPRSAVSSIINSIDSDPTLLKYLTIIPLRMQNYNTKEVIIHPYTYTYYPYLQFMISRYDEMMIHFTTIKETIKQIMGIPIDGIVLYFKNEELRNLLGRDGHINKYEVAYKFPPENTKTKLLSVEFCIGSLGSVTPVAKVKPVQLNNNTISNISLGSMDRFESLQLREDDEVIVKYDIIPYLSKDDTCESSNKPYIKSPTHCMYCKEKLIKDPILKCGNSECPSRIVGKIVNYIDKINIPNISIATVTTLFKEGYLKSIKDLYSLEEHKSEIIKLDGFGDKSFNNIIKGIKSRKKIFDYELLGAIGIPDIGVRMFKKILNIYYIQDLIHICSKTEISKLTSIYGIKEKTANKIIVGILNNLDLIKFLQKELEVKKDNRKYKVKVIFTKVRDKEFEEFLDSKNILIMNNYSKEVDILITKDKNTESTKIDKARKDGKEVITIDEAYELFNYKK